MLLAPQALSLVALVVASYGWIPCREPGFCSNAKDFLEVLSLAFPSGLIWFLMFATPNFEVALCGVIVLDLAIAVATWRLAPARLSLPQVTAFFLVWLALWGLTLWFFPYLADWGWALGHQR